MLRTSASTRTFAQANVLQRQLRKSPEASRAFAIKRFFSDTPRWQLQTKEMDEDALKSLRVNKQRLMDDLHHTCQWGTGKRWGQ